jgi:putative oxidoreductase
MLEDLLWYLGRLLLGGYFLYNAYNHFANLTMMAGYAQSKGVPSAKEAVLVSGILLAIGGLSVLFNTYLTIGLLALVLFLIPVTIIMHAFWKVQDPGARMGEMVNFAKNLALLGAVLIMLGR